LQTIHNEIKRLGANLVAISPQQDKYSKQIKGKHDLEFDILGDGGNKVAEEFGLKFGFPDYLIEVYKGFGADFERFNGDDSWTLPMPARYVVNQESIIVAADFDPDYTVRPEPSKTVEDLKNIS
jgi:peroxiredoxin